MATYTTTFDEIKYLAWLSTLTFNDWNPNTAIIKRLINQSNKKNATLAPAQYTDAVLSTVSSQASYDLPSDFSRMVNAYYLRGTRKIKIEELREEWYLMLESVVSSAIQFLYYTIRKTTESTVPKKKLWIYPIPSAITSIYYRYLTTQTDLNIDASVTTDSTKNLIAENWFENLDVYYALYHLFTQREQPTQAKQWKDEYDKKWKEYKAYVWNYYDTKVVRQWIRTSLNPNLYPTLS